MTAHSEATPEPEGYAFGVLTAILAHRQASRDALAKLITAMLFHKSFFLLFIVACLCLSACSGTTQNDTNSGHPTVIDEADIFDAEAEAYMESSYTFPPGIFVLVRTVLTIDAEDLATYAGADMEREDLWHNIASLVGADGQQIRRTSVYILVSMTPRLIQVRYGQDIRLHAYRYGLAMGSRYRRLQDIFTLSEPASGTLSALHILSQELPLALDIPWYLEWAASATSASFSEFEDIVSPYNDRFSVALLRPYLKAVETLGGFLSASHFLVVNLLVYISLACLAGVANAMIVTTTRSTRGSSWVRTTLRCLCVLSAIMLVLLVLLAAAQFLGAAMLLSNYRAEDYMFVENMGMYVPAYALGEFEWLWDPASLWMVLSITALNFVNLRAADPLRDKQIFVYGSDLAVEMLAVRVARRTPTWYFHWKYYRTGERSYVVKFHEYAYRPRVTYLLLLFMPVAVCLLATLKEVFELASLAAERAVSAFYAKKG